MSARIGPEVACPVTVEFEDVDSYGIAHHTQLVNYLERARLRLLKALGMDLSPGTVVPVLYRLDVRFVKPVRLLDELEVTAFVERFGEFRLDLGYRIRRGEETIARAATGIAFADLEQRTVVPVPEAYRAALERFRGTGG